MKIRKFIDSLIPQFLKNRINQDNYTIMNFIKWCSSEVKSTDLILDAGAGDCQYKSYFNHARYESTDFEDGFDESFKGKHTFTCDLSNIPQPSNKYDVILNNQVLEHVGSTKSII